MKGKKSINGLAFVRAKPATTKAVAMKSLRGSLKGLDRDVRRDKRDREV